METINVVNAARYRVTSSAKPHVGVCVEIFIASPSGERALQPFWLPPDAARALAQALIEQAGTARSRN